MSSTLHVRSVVASAFCVLDRYTSERSGRLRSMRGEGAYGVSAVGHNVLDELILLIQHHMADVMSKVTLFADVASIAAVVAGLCEGFEGSSVVDIHWNTGGGVHVKGCALLQGLWRWGDVSRGRRTGCAGEQSVLSALEWNE
jgi:hypothetical protein